MNIYQCYETLGLKAGSSMKEIKQAYRKLALLYHPDKDSSDGNEIRFKQISDAYQTLRLHHKTELKITKFTDLYPEDAVASYEQAEASIAKQNYEEAIVFYDKALERLPLYENAWLKKGDTLSRLKRHGEALDCYDKVLQINPESTDALNLKGICLSDLKKYDKSLECFDEATLLNPMHYAAWNFMGVCFFNLKKLEKALECFDKAIKIKPDFAVAWYNKSGVLLIMGKKKEAEKCYEKAKSL
ncbi:MAG TPA: tetratricopeptide repeat protein [Nitrosopumilaceae archaeon]|nr:tetratricopeptide repeat protein [Nitrosopumilaceae archaeon]